MPRNARWKAARGLRLGDCLVKVYNYGEKDFFQETDKAEFCVIDTMTRQKAWFEYPIGATLDNVAAMIEGHFDCSAFRVDARLWIV